MGALSVIRPRNNPPLAPDTGNLTLHPLNEMSHRDWNTWFGTLETFLQQQGRYPALLKDPPLYRWVMNQRIQKKRGVLDPDRIRRLDGIGFVWDARDDKWGRMFEKFREHAQRNSCPPSRGVDDAELVRWYTQQRSALASDGFASEVRKQRFSEVDARYAVPHEQVKWQRSFDELARFRQENPGRWPAIDRNDPDAPESRLHVFCLTMRKSHRDGSLDEYRRSRLEAIGFNLEGRNREWWEYHDRVKALLDSGEPFSADKLDRNTYSWVYRHRKALEDGTLPTDKAERVRALRLERFFETWEDRFRKVRDHVERQGGLPTRKSAKTLYGWLNLQKNNFRKGGLTAEQAAALRSVGFDLEARRKEDQNRTWQQRLHQYTRFIRTQGREPSYFTPGEEKTLYMWAAAQRAVKAGTARNRKPLTPEREEALRASGFNFVGEGRGGEKAWEEHLRDLVACLRPNGVMDIPSIVNGRRNPLYTWWIAQKKAYEKGELPEDRLRAFQQAGIDLPVAKNETGTRGYARWAKRMEAIAEFVKRQGQYPKGGRNREEDNLYQSLRRTKKAIKAGDLTERQLAFLESLPLDLRDDGREPLPATTPAGTEGVGATHEGDSSGDMPAPTPAADAGDDAE